MSHIRRLSQIVWLIFRPNLITANERKNAIEAFCFGKNRRNRKRVLTVIHIVHKVCRYSTTSDITNSNDSVIQEQKYELSKSKAFNLNLLLYLLHEKCPSSINVKQKSLNFLFHRIQLFFNHFSYRLRLQINLGEQKSYDFVLLRLIFVIT